jgi:hypothetical protein
MYGYMRYKARTLSSMVSESLVNVRAAYKLQKEFEDEYGPQGKLMKRNFKFSSTRRRGHTFRRKMLLKVNFSSLTSACPPRLYLSYFGES